MKMRTAILSCRNLVGHRSSLWRRCLFYCSHRDGTCSVELKTWAGAGKKKGTWEKAVLTFFCFRGRAPTNVPGGRG